MNTRIVSPGRERESDESVGHGRQVVLPIGGPISPVTMDSAEDRAGGWPEVMQGLMNAEERVRQIAAQVRKLRAEFDEAAHALTGRQEEK